VVVTAQGVELYYTHWGANVLDRELFWGPVHATAFARAQRSEAEGAEWLDDVWSEGGAVIDHTQRLLLWYGGEDILYDVPRRRVLFELMRTCWQGWQVHWAAQGIVDLAQHVGISKQRVLTVQKSERTAPPTPPTFPCPERKDWIDAVITVVERGTVRVMPIQGHPGHFMADGALLLPALRTAEGLPQLNYAEWSSEFPTGGMHVDFDQNMFGIWLSAPFEDVEQRAARALPGLRFEWWRDEYERQLALTPSILTFPKVDLQACLEANRAKLLGGSSHPVQSLLQGIAALQNEGRTVANVNPFALRDDPVPVPTGTQAEIVARAIAEYTQRLKQ
jgi:hypothetical protein